MGSNPDTKDTVLQFFFCLLLEGCRIASCVRAGTDPPPRVESCREAVSTPGYLAPPLLSSPLLPPFLNLPVRRMRSLPKEHSPTIFSCHCQSANPCPRADTKSVYSQRDQSFYDDTDA